MRSARHRGTVRYTTAFFLAVVVGIMLQPAARDAEAHAGSHPYTHWASGDKWYQLYSDSGSYVTWMTLSYDTHYDCSGCSTGWSSHVNAGLAAWNNSNTTIYYSNAGSHSSANDVHVYILSSAALQWGGIDEVYDESYTNCGAAHNCTASQSRPNTWWYEYAYGNDYYVPLDPFLPNERTALIAHELGHGLSFNHPGGVGSDGSCGVAHIMDYDCIWGGQYQLGAASDVCGVNHMFYDPNWGYSGCQ